MNETHLIQRLTAPTLRDGVAIMNPFSFGGGGGRLSPQALELLLPVFSFDYMGAAEYEFGAVPEALSMIFNTAKAEKLFFSKLDIKVKDIKERDLIGEQNPRTWESCPVYIIGNSDDQEEISRRVRLLATDEMRCMAEGRKKPHDGLGVRDSVQLDRFIAFEPTHDRNPIGWLELNNGFFFSVDRTMTQKFAKLFGLLIEIKTAQ